MEIPKSARKLVSAKDLSLLLIAIVVGVLYGLIVYGLMEYWNPQRGLISVAFLLGAPIAVPSLAVIVFDPSGKYDAGTHAAFGIAVVTAMVIAGFFVLREGGLCTLMASPLFYVVGTLGSIGVGKVLRHRQARLLSIAFVLMPFIGVPIEQTVVYPAMTETVTSSIDISAPPGSVWKNTIAVRHIKPSELGWTFTQSVIGVPEPVDARLAGHGAGAIRYVTWGGGIHFQERVARWDENKRLDWNFQFARDSVPSAIEGHIKVDSPYLKIESGSYRLDALPGGRTRLTLQTRYWMRTPLNAYCAWWGRIFIADFHRNVLRIIRERSEQRALSTG